MRNMNSLLGERGRKVAVASAGALAFFGAGVGVEWAINNTGGSKTLVSGTVECASGRQVVGVWVQAMEGSGWAAWSSNPQQRSIASYSRNLPHPETYGVHVGCGGNPDDWASSNFSPGVSSNEQPDFLCYDTAPKSTTEHRLGTCAVINS